MVCVVTSDLNRYQRQVDEQEMFDIEIEKVGAQMLVDLELDGEFTVAQKGGISKVVCYYDLVAEFAENNPEVMITIITGNKENRERAAKLFSEKLQDFVIEQINEDYAVEHIRNQER